MPLVCDVCGTSMPDNSSFCPSCGKSITRRESVPAAVTQDRASAGQPVTAKTKLMAAVAYVTFLPAIVFLLLDPFKRDRFVRFHAFQSLLFAGGVLLIAIALRIMAFVLLLLPGFGLLFMLLMITLVAIAIGLVWLVLLLKAVRGEEFRLGLIGQLAERLA